MLEPRCYVKGLGSVIISDYKKIKEMEYLPWDGSSLGIITDLEEESRLSMGRELSLVSFTYGDYNIRCLAKKVETSLPAIFDEVKPYFGLPKIGTHLFKYKSDFMIAFKTTYHQNNVVTYPTLDVFKGQISPRLGDQIRLTLMFRQIFGITDTFEKSLIVRIKKGGIEIVSFLEPGSVVINNPQKSILPENLVRKWFDEQIVDKSQNATLRQLICYNQAFPESSLAYYRDAISEVIKRIEPDLTTYSDLFYDRLCNRL